MLQSSGPPADVITIEIGWIPGFGRNARPRSEEDLERTGIDNSEDPSAVPNCESGVVTGACSTFPGEPPPNTSISASRGSALVEAVSGHQRTRVLIDCGMGVRQLEQALARLQRC